MYIYIITFVCSLFFYRIFAGRRMKYTVFNTKKKYSVDRVSIAVFFAAIPPMFIAAVRYYVGTDYLTTYYTGFYRILEGSKIDRFEFGYYWLNRIIQLFTDNVFVLFIITAVIYVGVTYKSIKELSDDIPLSIILFLVTRYYFIGLNGVRQFIALAILTYSLKYVFRKDVKRFIFCCIAATSFHYMSVLFVPVYFLGRLELSKSRVIRYIVIVFLVFTGGTRFILRLLQNTKYGALTQRFGVAGFNFTLLTIFINVVLFTIAYSNYENRKTDDRYRTYLNVQFFALLSSLVIRTIPLLERVYWVYSFPIIVTFPYFLQGTKIIKSKKIIKYFVILLFFAYMLYDIVVLGDHDVLPYQWIFGKTPVHNSGWRWYR